MKKKSDNPNAVWRRQNIERVKMSIVNSLSEYDGSPKMRLRKIWEQITHLNSEGSPSGRLDRFVYCLSALNHHLFYGGLSSYQIKRLGRVAGAILKIQGVKPSYGRLSFLYADLHSMLGQIQWRAGDQWTAAWNQQLAHHISTGSVTAKPEVQELISGMRALRLGHASLAIEYFEKAIVDGIVRFEQSVFGIIIIGYFQYPMMFHRIF